MKWEHFQPLDSIGERISSPWKCARFAVLFLAPAVALPAEAPDFSADIRPVLSGNCFKCHGPDDKARDSGLRLDLREAATKPARSGKTAIVPGKPDRSEMLRRIFSDDPKIKMPPPASNKTLTDGQKNLLKNWIATGAAYKPHWAFLAPKQAAAPEVKQKDWPRNPVDHFVLARLERENLKPSPPADPPVLCRRIYLDLIGLPPTPEEVDAFSASAKTNLEAAVASLADQLLASPHYGERWARRWLDLAMYADTNGYEKDRPRSIWPYRDWVIRAMNAGMPFDQFTMFQVAGDLLGPEGIPAGTDPLDARIATGFFRNTMLNEEGGIDPLEYRFAAMTARMQMTGSAWLGLTLQCAQCHTHKFDPITHREYFQLMAFINNADEPELALPSGAADDQEAKRAARADQLLAALPDQWPVAAGEAKPARPVSVVAASGQVPRLLDDHSALFAEASPDADSYTVTIDSDAAAVGFLRLDALSDEALPSKGPGRVAHGNFVLTEVVVTAAPRSEPGRAQPVRIARATADVEQERFPAADAIDGNPKSGWAVHRAGGAPNASRSATFHFEKPVGFAGGTRFVVRLDQLYGNQHTLGRIRLAPGAPAGANQPAAKPREVAERRFDEWLKAQRAQRTAWTVIAPAALKSNLPFLEPQADGSVLASGDITKHDTYELKFTGDFTGVRAIRLEALPDAALPDGGPGLCYYEGPKGDFFMGEFSVAVAGVTQKFAAASQSYAKNNFGDRAVSALAATDGDLQTGWSCAGRTGERHEAVFNLAAPLDGARELAVKMDFGRHYACPLGRFRLSVSTGDRAVARDFDDGITALLAMPDDQLTAEQRRRLREQFLMTAPELAEARKAVVQARKPAKETTTLVLRERPARNPRPTPVYHRGEFLQPGEPVPPGTLAVLNPFPAGAPRDRLGFARWLVSPENPLTARVVVNREWSAFFGGGIVRTLADFGYQGEMPSHPDLLDWLAVEFVKQGWSQKQLHRLIVTSATYQQSSTVPRELHARDPGNRLLARGPRVRLEAELIRDSLLRASGLLSAKMGGPSVFPPQPEGIATEGAYGKLDWKVSEGEDRHRRAIYTFAKRTAPYAMFATFDAPSGEACVARREVSDSALQSLTTLNDTVFLESAQALGTLLAKQTSSPTEKIQTLFRRALVRPATDNEVAAMLKFYEAQKTRFAGSADAAKKIAGSGDGDVTERAAWTALARAILNLDEFVTKE